jgi:hypothetical protein
MQQIGRALQSIRASLQFPPRDSGTQYASPRNFGGEARREVAEAFAAIPKHLEDVTVDPDPAEGVKAE